MRPVTRRTARAVILADRGNGTELVLIHRTRPGAAPYWVTPGGGVEDTDTGLLAALHREVAEEIGGAVAGPVLVFIHTEPRPTPACPDGVKAAYFFACRLLHLDDAARHGPETDTPRGTYETTFIPYTPAALAAVNLTPAPLAGYLAANREAVTALVAPPPPGTAPARPR